MNRDLLNGFDVNAFLQEVFTQLVYTFGIWGLGFSFVLLIFLMIIQAIVTPLVSEAILTAAGAVFFEAFGSIGLVVAIIGGIVGSTLAGITGYYVAYFLRSQLGKSYNRFLEREAKVDNLQNSLNRRFRKSWRRLVKFFARLTERETNYLQPVIDRRGFYFILLARLLPFVAFDTISNAAGFVKMDFRKFVLATFLGSIPRVIFFMFAGVEFLIIFYDNFQLFVLVFVGFSLFMIIGYMVFRRIVGHIQFSNGKQLLEDAQTQIP